jgi:hydrophobic/amphiphilic exporter-1 (mainly G- bacteria), HAE1 family
MQKLAEVCIRRPVFATMLIVALTVIGAFCFATLGTDRFPDVQIPFITVITTNPGASPEEMEREITNRIESSVSAVGGIELFQSSSVEGLSQVMLQFNLDKNVDVAASEVRQKVDLVLNDLPRSAKPPIVQKFGSTDAPVIQYAISSGRPLVDLTDVVQRELVERLESVDGVGTVRLYGGRDREVQIAVDPTRLRAYGLTIAEVTNSLRAQNIELPGGSLEQGQKRFNLRTQGKITSVSQFEELVLASRSGYAIRVRDIARVEDRGADPISTALRNGETAILVDVVKQSKRNTMTVIAAVKERMQEIEPTLPKDLKISVVRDSSVYIGASLASIQEHLIFGGLLAAIVVYAFLRNFRSTVIAAIAIPTSIISSFGVMAALGYTLNEITMLSLTLMVGIVIDDAIVVLENIYRFMDEKGLDPYQAAIEGTREIGLAVMATTMSLLAVFVPIGFMGGIVGRFMSSFGLTAAAAIAVSLLVSFTLTPMLCARWVDKKRKREAHVETYTGWYGWVDKVYMSMLRWSMNHRWAIVVLCVLIVASTVPIAMNTGASFLPEEDEGEINVNVRLSPGTSLAATESMMERMAGDIRREVPNVTQTLVIAGYNSQQIPNAGSIFVKLTPAKERDISQSDVMTQLRKMMKRYPTEVFTSVMPVDAFGSNDRAAAVMIAIAGPDLKKLEQYSGRLLDKLRADQRMVDTDRSMQPTKPELQIRIQRDRAADLDVPVLNIASTLNTLFAGEEVGTFSRGKNQYKIRVRAEREARQQQESIMDVMVPSNQGQSVELRNLVSVGRGTGPDTIDHIYRERQVMMYANVAPTSSESEVLEGVMKHIDEMKMEPGYHVVAQGNSKELQKANYYFMLAFSLSFIFMYIVLAAQFESFLHPITILLTLPISVPFGLLSLLLTGQKVNIFSALGVLLLFGVVKKNAILQIDHTNELRKRGLDRATAILEANRHRLRPILMTTIALVAGMLPMVIGVGPGAATNRSVAVLVIGGQSLCLLITLLAVPVFYSLFEDGIDWVKRRFRREQTAEAEVPVAVLR